MREEMLLLERVRRGLTTARDGDRVLWLMREVARLRGELAALRARVERASDEVLFASAALCGALDDEVGDDGGSREGNSSAVGCGVE